MSDLYNITFKGGATSDLIEEFNERKKYQNYPGFEKYKTVDTLFKDFNYGILNKDYYPVSVVVDNPELDLQNFPDFAQDVYVLPFVAKAFEDLRKDYVYFIENSPENVQQAIALGIVNPTQNFGLLSYPKYLEGLAPVKGYLNFENEYSNYLNFNMIEYLDILTNTPEIVNSIRTGPSRSAPFNISIGRKFTIFMSAFIKIFQERARKFPLTKSGFSTSRHCSIMTTGLCIELADLDYNLDGPKGEMITNSDFECFADYANHYGFMIDKNAPWRLVADLDSDAMKEYIVQGHRQPKERAIQYFDSYARTKNHLDDLFCLDDFIARLFVVLHGEESRAQLAQSAEYQDKKYWIDTLFKVRALELAIPQDQEYQRKKQEILDLLDINTIRYAENKIGLICSQKLREIYGPN